MSENATARKAIEDVIATRKTVSNREDALQDYVEYIEKQFNVACLHHKTTIAALKTAEELEKLDTDSLEKALAKTRKELNFGNPLYPSICTLYRICVRVLNVKKRQI